MRWALGFGTLFRQFSRKSPVGDFGPKFGERILGTKLWPRLWARFFSFAISSFLGRWSLAVALSPELLEFTRVWSRLFCLARLPFLTQMLTSGHAFRATTRLGVGQDVFIGPRSKGSVEMIFLASLPAVLSR